MFKGKVIRSDSLDPHYKVTFSYSSNKCNIADGVAIFTRTAPTPVVTFDDYTDYLIESQNIDESEMQNIRLEIGQTVCNYLFNI